MLKDVSPYFVFDGNAAEAIEFYSNVFHTKILDVTYFRDMPADPDFPMTDDVKDLVLNGSIELPNGGPLCFRTICQVCLLLSEIKSRLLSFLIMLKTHEPHMRN